ncbi:kinase-like protein, partial [Glonium stellatum]
TIGSGGTASVRKIHFKSRSQASLALKETFTLKKKEVVSDLIREFYIMSVLRHAHVVYSYCMLLNSHHFGLLMPLADSDLNFALNSSWIGDAAAFPFVVTDFGCLISATAHLHETGVIHGDIKPSNILGFKNGDGAHLWKIADFGISKIERHKHETVSFSSSTVPLFTPKYAAPEVVQCPIVREYSSDIFSLGCVLAEVL